MSISAQQLTIYLYSAHRAVIFAIAQLSCCLGLCLGSDVCLCAGVEKSMLLELWFRCVWKTAATIVLLVIFEILWSERHTKIKLHAKPQNLEGSKI